MHPTFSGYASGAQALTGSYTVIQINSKSWDDGSNFSTDSHLYTCPVDGRYRVNAAVQNGSATQSVHCAVYQNGSLVREGTFAPAAGGTAGPGYLDLPIKGQRVP